MSTADGEQLATVTWLFGSPDAPAAAESSPSARSEPSARPEASAPPEAPPSVRLDAARAALDTASAVAAEEPPSKRGSFARINNVSMHALARRGMSSWEMRDYLIGREFESDEVYAEIERLESVGLLDDGELAETLVRRLQERKGLGRSALVAELKRRKLHSDAIDAAMAQLETDDELDRAIELAQRRAPQLRSLDADTAKRRLGAFLMRKGYSGGVVSAAVARALEPSGPRFR